MASIVLGKARIQNLTFQSFLDSDSRISIFSGSTNNALLMSATKSQQPHALLWNIPENSYTLEGKFYIVCAPTVTYKYGSPPRLVNIPDEESSADFWEAKRLEAWKSISVKYRASFSWQSSESLHTPPMKPLMKLAFCNDERSVESITPPKEVIKSMSSSLNSLHMNDNKMTKSRRSNSEIDLHDSAYESFVLVVFKCASIDHVEENLISPPSRVMFVYQKDGTWIETDSLQ